MQIDWPQPTAPPDVPPGRVIIATHPTAEANCLQNGLVVQARARLDVPIMHIEVDGHQAEALATWFLIFDLGLKIAHIVVVRTQFQRRPPRADRPEY
jgi:hypothetical protein